MKSTTQFAIVVSYLSGVSALQSLKPYPDASAENGIENVKQWAAGLPDAGAAQFKETFGADARYRASPAYWGDESIYQIFIERFNNGDAANDRLNIAPWQQDQENNGQRYDLHNYRMGGDLKGIIDRLDYIKDLGSTALWITPIFTNVGGDYHGYCVSDFLEIDPAFGTLEELQYLVAEAHNRDMKIVLDIVVNHMCYPNTQYENPEPEGSAPHKECSSSLAGQNWGGYSGFTPNQGWLNFDENHFGPFKNNYFFNRCGANTFEEMSTESDPAVYGDFVAAMKDFDTNNQDWQYIFTQIHKYWISVADVDGFRLDATKHVTEAFVSYFSPHIRAHAESLGKSNFYLIGEIAAGSEWQGRYLGNQYTNLENPDEHGNMPLTAINRIKDVKPVYDASTSNKYPGLNAIYDFAHSGISRDVLRGSGYNAIQLQNWMYGQGYTNIASQADPGLFWIHTAIHDWPRTIEGHIKKSTGHAISSQAYIAFARGIPVLYYGDEMALNGDCLWDRIDTEVVGNDGQNKIQEVCGTHDHALYRQTFWQGGGYNLGSALDNLNNLAYIGNSTANTFSQDWQNDPMLATNSDVYKSIRRFMHIRKSCIALQRGVQVFRYINNDIIAFSRIFYDKEAVVIVNPKSSILYVPNFQISREINGASGQKYRNLLNGFEYATVGLDDAAGTAWLNFPNGFSIPPHGAAVFVHENLVAEYDAGIETHICNDLGRKATPLEVEGKPDSVGVIAGATVAGVVAVGAALLVGVKLQRRRSEQSNFDENAVTVAATAADFDDEEDEKLERISSKMDLSSENPAFNLEL